MAVESLEALRRLVGRVRVLWAERVRGENPVGRVLEMGHMGKGGWESAGGGSCG